MAIVDRWNLSDSDLESAEVISECRVMGRASDTYLQMVIEGDIDSDVTAAAQAELDRRARLEA